MYNLKKKVLVDIVNYQGKFLIANERHHSWTLINEVKYVLEYKCYAAISTIGNDTIKAWYAPELAKPFGPQTYRDLPGVILEIQDQQYNQQLIAVRVDKGNFRLVFPNHKIISSGKYRKPKKQGT